MKKILLLATACAFIFAACDDSSSSPSTDSPDSTSPNSSESIDSSGSIDSEKDSPISSNSIFNNNSGKCPYDETLVDSRDGKTYKTVKIGEQVWMAENLNFETTSSWTNDSLDKDGDVYGRYYSHGAALRACPDGWHLPSRDEIRVLSKAAGGEEKAGINLKSTSGWDKTEDGKDGNGKDTYCFNAKAGGESDGEEDGAYNVGISAHLWTKDTYNPPPQIDYYTGLPKYEPEEYFILIVRNDSAWIDRNSVIPARNIRCLKGEPEPEVSAPESSMPIPDSLREQYEQDLRQEQLIKQFDSVQNPEECEAIEGLSETEIEACKRRFRSLHPEYFYDL